MKGILKDITWLLYYSRLSWLYCDFFPNWIKVILLCCLGMAFFLRQLGFLWILYLWKSNVLVPCHWCKLDQCYWPYSCWLYNCEYTSTSSLHVAFRWFCCSGQQCNSCYSRNASNPTWSKRSVFFIVFWWDVSSATRNFGVIFCAASQGQQGEHTLGVNGLILQIILEFWKQKDKSVEVTTYYNSVTLLLSCQLLSHSWKKEISESLTVIEPMTSQTHDGHSIHWATRTHGEQGHLTEFVWDSLYVTDACHIWTALNDLSLNEFS